MPTTLRLGTRGSKLARWQADWVAAQLTVKGHAVEIIEIRTTGDAQPSGPIDSTTSPGLFTKEIQRALVASEVDLAVHSLKDLPTQSVKNLTLAAVPKRESAADALIGRTFRTLAEAPQGAVVGVGSLRRRAQLAHLRPDLVLADIRGNVDTRLRKLEGGEYDAIMLAEAGLTRLGWAERITERLDPATFIPAPGQGALGIECRTDDAMTRAALAALNDSATLAAITAERTCMAKLEGGCLAALGAWARPDGEGLLLSATVLSDDGGRRLDREERGAEAVALGEAVAEALLAQGAVKLLRNR
jgi:hydroxymethylbilane synthase